MFLPMGILRLLSIMKNESYIRYLLNDKKSLHQYFSQNKAVNIDELKRYLLLKVREQQYSVPDHYYRLGTEYSFDGISNLSDVFTIGIPKLANEYLEIWNGRVYVIGEKFNDWQLLLPEMPPLLLIVAKLWREFRPNIEPLSEFARQYLQPSVCTTAFPSPYIPEMKTVEKKIKGFSDLHIHLNGAVETDLVWHDLLRFPEKAYLEIRMAFDNPKVKEQFEQMSDITNPIDFQKLFLIAGRLRQCLFERVMGYAHKETDMTFNEMLTMIANSSETYKEHPMKACLGSEASPLILEGMLYVKTFDYLSTQRQDNTTARLMHYYLLILGLTNRLLVQQTDAFGFEQFQKYTSNNFRELSEKTYTQRFLQLAGNELTGLRHIEGRFSPKDSLKKNIQLIAGILNGFEKLCNRQEKKGISISTLTLIAHFIKKPDKWKGDIRFLDFRNDLEKRADALIALRNSGGRESKVFTGIDAAASEFDTPPEVFAPVYHRLRKAGFEYFTYHAGEDFYHILTGLRAIYEAMMYLELRPGDRIGHATASGVDVRLWRCNIGERMWMRIEDYLDDLTFVYFLIAESKDKQLEHLLPLIALRCQEYSAQVYGKAYGMHELISAWQLRKKNPLDNDMKGESTEKQIFNFRHSKTGRELGNKIITVNTYDILEEEDLIRCQQLLLKIMHKRQIVIETLPTSNIIIGHHHDFRTYHLYNWYRWGKEGYEIPAITVGCDDAGIFATNIYNEYCHIYCMLVFDKGLPPMEAMDFIQHLAQNSDAYRFQ